MRIFQNDVRFEITTGFCVYLALLILLFPLPWVASWLVATILHELCHYCAISALKIKVNAVIFLSNGIQLKTAPMGNREEVLCALAGPLGGLLLLLFAKWLPYIAICALVQSAYNLLPIYPLDGGRALRGIINSVIPERYRYRICRGIEWVALIAVCLLCILAFWVLKLGWLPLVALCILIAKCRLIKIPCKQSG